MTIQVEKCQGTDCKTDTEINEAMKTTIVTIIMANSFFDYQEFDQNPIKTYLSNRRVYTMLPDYQARGNIFLQYNQIESNDYIVDLDIEKNSKFWASSDHVDSYSVLDTNETIVFKLDIQLDSISLVHNRSVFTILEMTGQIGGLFEVLHILFGIIAHQYSKTLFKFCILESLYHNSESSNDTSSNNKNESDNSKKDALTRIDTTKILPSNDNSISKNKNSKHIRKVSKNLKYRNSQIRLSKILEDTDK